ncbi:hypothetical protein [Streptomyces aurantiogriseus]|uniref:Uncharacterized protein n=1 Tax=Streptomyces aurantiogriseus TaxID=66870 RepID=A0A918FMY8_9ACTN|nr:hypothetical protein [Streptomyces aurantiogriseus]GGR57472.1 hypothetical protein GCM10010251_87930 [Streptomyces aurantiogriseus]
MSITQQYALDAYRARQHGEPVPPAPGAHDWQVIRELRDRHQFHAVLAGRPAHGRIRRVLGRLLRSRPRPTC